MRTFSLALLWGCNEDCAFCAKGKAPPGVKPAFSFSEAMAEIRRKRAEGFESLHFDGGEPTLLPFLPRLARESLKLGFRAVAVMTNGVALSDMALVRRFKAAAPSPASVLSFCVSLHSRKKSVSESLTRSRGTFERTLRGLANLEKAGLPYSLYHVITKKNYRDLPGYASFVLKRLPGARAVNFSYIYPVKHNYGVMPDLYPRLSSVQPYFARAVARLRRGGKAVSTSPCGMVPLCVMRGYEKLFAEMFLNDGNRPEGSDTSRSEVLPFFSESFNDREKVKAPSCRACALDRVCGGVWNFYPTLYGFSEFKPFRAGDLPAPGKGRVRLAPLPPGKYADPCAAEMIRLLQLRLGGTVRAEYSAGPACADALRSFAKGIGFVRLDFGGKAQPRRRQ